MSTVSRVRDAMLASNGIFRFEYRSTTTTDVHRIYADGKAVAHLNTFVGPSIDRHS